MFSTGLQFSGDRAKVCRMEFSSLSLLVDVNLVFMHDSFVTARDGARQIGKNIVKKGDGPARLPRACFSFLKWLKNLSQKL